MGHPPPPRRRSTGRAAATSCVAVLLCLACDRGPDAPTLDLPPRPADAPGGEEIIRDILTLPVEAREERILAEVAGGNVPTWLRRLRPVEITGHLDGRARAVTVWVMPDYLAVGSDSDYFYVPLSARTARRIADLSGASLPTPGMVGAIWAAARVRLIPIRIPPGESMGTVRVFQRHSSLVRAQARQHRARRGSLIAGHKLDVVIPTVPVQDAEAAAVYGWHMPDGAPIQPLHPIDPDDPPHFSMGVRLVHRDILVDGAPADLADVLRDPELSRLLARP